ncbi:uncharacterized protein RJT21DRAFT_4742 [Scheffersomyces amazonensis]|uniref:uncharacterized protein n=1 Tax=Scheffersomyces amazonensis TaxID=1078765 RepID=UPI00315D55EA
MSKIHPMKSSLTALVRYLSSNHKNNKNENVNVILADALNLLSPKGSPPPNNYKPSLFNNLTKGSAAEQFKPEDFIPPSIVNTTSTDLTSQYVSSLLLGIKVSSISNKLNINLSQMTLHELSNFIKSVNQEKKLFDLMEILYSQNKLSFKCLTDIILNPNFKHLDKSPIDIVQLVKKWDNPIHQVQFNIILLKKYHDLKKQSHIEMNLKQYFHSSYYPLIQLKKLSPFYERIVWRFELEYGKDYDSSHYIEELGNLQSSFLIWESSTENNKSILSKILETHRSELNQLQTLFLEVSNHDIFQNKISQELSTNSRSPTLSTLKKISIKHQISNLNYAANDENVRLTHYSVVNKLEEIVLNELIGEPQNKEGIDILKKIKTFRESYVKQLTSHNQKEQDDWSHEVSIAKV